MQSRLAVPIKLEAKVDQGVHQVIALLLRQGEGGEISAQPSARLVCGKAMRPGQIAP